MGEPGNWLGHSSEVHLVAAWTKRDGLEWSVAAAAAVVVVVAAAAGNVNLGRR